MQRASTNLTTSAMLPSRRGLAMATLAIAVLLAGNLCYPAAAQVDRQGDGDVLTIKMFRSGKEVKWNVAGLLTKVGAMERDNEGDIQAGYDKENDTVYFVMRTKKRYLDDSGQQRAAYELFLMTFHIRFYDQRGIRVQTGLINWETGRKDDDHHVLAIGTIDLSHLDATDRDRIVEAVIE